MRLVNQNWWFTTLLVSQHKYCPPLTKDIKCDVAIVGAGFAGVSAAAQFLRKGLKVVLIDKNIVGGSSSGRSAGFLTPDSELELHQLCRRYGNEAAREIWDAPCRGIDIIVSTIKEHDIKCGLLEQDSLFLGLGKGGFEAAKSELDCRKDVGFTDQKLYDAEQLKAILGSEGYTAGIRYGGTYGINPLQCLQGFKDVLVDNGMQVFESTAMKRLEDHTIYTHGGSITADHIIIAVDKLEPHISPLSAEVFHAQTFLSVTEPLTDAETQHPVSVGRADAVLGLEAGLHLLPADGRQSPAAGRRLGDHHVPQGRVQQSRDHQARHRGLLRTLSAAQEPGVHPVLAGPDRHHARSAAHHRAGQRTSRTCASSSAAWEFPGRRSPAVSRRAMCSAMRTTTTASTSTTSRTSAISGCRAASAR